MPTLSAQASRLAAIYSKSKSELPVFLVLFDEAGIVVPTEQVTAALTPNVLPTGVQSFSFEPGSGYYAHLKRGAMRVGIAVGGEETVWEIAGPDWSCELTWSEPYGGTPHLVHFSSSKMSAAGVAFLGRF